MHVRGRLAINDATTDGELLVMRQSTRCGAPGDSDGERSPLYSHGRRALDIGTLRMLLLEDDAEAKQRIISAVCMTPTDVHCVSSVAAGLFFLDSNHFDVIVIDRHLGGWVTAQS
jgi:hypothetical protein